MIVVGVDSGLTRLGLGAVKIEGDELDLLTYGMIAHPRSSDSKYNAHLNEGIRQIVDGFPRFLDIAHPTFIVGETVPPGRLGSNSELVVAAITSCKVIAFQFGIDWYDIAANTVKLQVTGDGRATKAKIRNTILDSFPLMAERHTKMKKEQKKDGEKAVGLPQDVFDAVAVAIAGARKHASSYEEGQAQDTEEHLS